jgi:ferredoxin
MEVTKPTVDRTKCTGIGLCEMTAPAVFEVGDDGQAQALQSEVAEQDLAAAQEAVANCPTGAVSIEQGGTTNRPG